MKKKLLLATALLTLGGLTTATAWQDSKLPVKGDQTPVKTQDKAAGKDGTTKDTAAKETPKAPETLKVTKGKIVIDIPIKGIFEATNTTELSFHLDAWSGMNARSAVPHGKSVQKGDVLVTLDSEKIDKALKDAELDQQLAEIAFKQAEEDLKYLEKTTAMDIANLELNKKYADEDYKKLVEQDFPMMKRNIEFSLKSSTNFTQYTAEELKQLEKMYLADDIKEGTEEIILKRQRDQLESSQNNLLNAQKRRDESINIDIPRRELSAKEANVRSQMSYEKSKLLIPTTLKKAQIGFEKTKLERARSLEKYDQLKKDREKMVLKAPVDGVVYYGKCTKGAWSAPSSIEGKFIKGGYPISNDEVIMTIVQSKNFIIRSTVEEKDIQLVKVGQAVKIAPVAEPNKKLNGTIDYVGTIPAGGSYEIKVKVDSTPESIMAGMAATAKARVYSKLDALVLPSASIFTEEDDEDVSIVYVPGGEGKDPVKKVVKVGKKSGDKTEILEGLSDGDTVLKDKPAAKKP